MRDNSIFVDLNDTSSSDNIFEEGKKLRQPKNMATSTRINTSADQNQPYQGYPYRNPVVIDVSTIDAVTAAKWNNLPRRPITSQIKTAVVDKSTNQDNTADSSRRKGDESAQKIDEDRPVIYVPMPEDAGPSTQPRHDRREDNRGTSTQKIEDTVYIPLPEDSGRSNSNPSHRDRGKENPAFEEVNQNDPPRSQPEQTAKKEEDVPVVYIPMPDETHSNSSSVTIPQDREDEQPNFVGETIFYDPFENRQIDMTRPKETSETVEDSSRPSRPAPALPSPLSPDTPETSYRSPRPAPPSSLNLNSPNGPSYNPLTTSSALPEFIRREPQVYGSPCMDDGFSLTPLPVTDYSRPPPAYSEIDNPPRTQVVVVTSTDQSPTVGLPSTNRKLVQCQQCGLRVHTLVTRENGALTHFIAFITVCFCIFPLTAMVYCTNCLKYQVHYCPNCNYKVGHEIPFLSSDLEYNRS